MTREAPPWAGHDDERAGELELATLTAPAAVEELPADEWDALVEALPRPSPCLLHGWVVERLRHGVGEVEPRVHVARRGARLVGALPFEVVQRGGLRVAGFVGGPDTAWGDVLLAPDEPEETARRLVEHAARSDQLYGHLYGLSADSRLARHAALALVERVPAPSFDLSQGWDAVYLRKVSRGHRKDHRRKRRGLEQLGRLETTIARTPVELEAALAHTFRLHELRWSGRYDRSGYTTPASRRFIGDVVARLARGERYRIVMLELDGTPIAFLSFFVVGNAFVGHRTGFDPAYAKFSPGALIFFEGFAAPEAEGLTRVELGSGEERFKHSLADSMEPLFDGYGLATGVLGAVASAAGSRTLSLRHRLKSMDPLRAVHRRVHAVAAARPPAVAGPQ
jgi:CelD/BcsL family acetyltransferase involved in cellulose biosynthesis